MTPFKGNAAFTWAEDTETLWTGDTTKVTGDMTGLTGDGTLLSIDAGVGNFQSTDRAYLLNRPLDRVQYAVRRTNYAGNSLDVSQRQVFSLGRGVTEITAQVRYDDDPTDLTDLLRFGQAGGTINYWPDLNNDQEQYACLLIDPIDAKPMPLEHDYPAVGDMVTVVLRLIGLVGQFYYNGMGQYNGSNTYSGTLGL